MRAKVLKVIIIAVLSIAALFGAEKYNTNVNALSTEDGDNANITYNDDDLAFFGDYDEQGLRWSTHYFYANGNLAYCANVKKTETIGDYSAGIYNGGDLDGYKRSDLTKLMAYIYQYESRDSEASRAVFDGWVNPAHTGDGYNEYYAYTHAVIGYINDGEVLHGLDGDGKIINAINALKNLIDTNSEAWQKAKIYVLFRVLPNNGMQDIMWIEPPVLKTTATDDADGDKFIEDGLVTIKDTVTYNVLPGVEFTLRGVLMDKNTGEEVIIDGDTVESERVVYTDQEEGDTTDLLFTFDAFALGGKEIVVFERLYYGDELIVEHADINDEAQTVTVVSLGTTAAGDTDNSKFAEVGENTTIVDTVNYCATPNTRFTIKGKLINKSDNNNVIMESEPVAISVPASGCGSEDIKFEFDGTGLGGDTLVVFETLYNGNDIVIEHADLNDEGQSVVMVSLDSDAKDQKDGDKFIESGNEIIIRDTVQYCAAPGSSLKIEGKLMDKKENQPIIQNGDPVIVIVPITVPDSGCGSKDVLFNIDASEYEGKEIVIFESLYAEDNTIILEHEDLNDLNQTVTIISLRTYATNKETGTKILPYGEDVVINDRVYYCLVVGEEYTIRGILMNRETGEPILINGQPVTDEVTFTPEEDCCGEFDMTYELNTGELGGAKLVIFENLYHDGELIIEHVNLANVDESIDVDPVPAPDTGYITKEESGIKAADNYAIILAGISAIAFIGLTVITFKYVTMKD